MKLKVHTKLIRDNVVDMHIIGKGYKTISKCLDILVSTVGRIMRKCKLRHTTQALKVASPEGGPSKLHIRAGSGVVREATMRTAVTLKDRVQWLRLE